MAHQGYYRFPTLWNDTVIFTCEDDLWSVQASGGVARRLTSNIGECSRSIISPDGTMLAFTGKEEGNPEVYIMPAQGGSAKRLTYQGAALGTHVIGWSPDGSSVIFASNAGQPFLKLYKLFSISANGGVPEELPYGAAMSISYGPGKRAVIARNTLDIARWKRYRGGTAGVLWVDAKGDGNFKQLLSLKGNFSSPMWIGNRIYFIGDHEGIGNVYSCKPDGTDVRRHTDHDEYYARNASTDGKNIVYHAGGDIYFLDVAANKSRKINIDFLSPVVQQNRKFVDAAKYLQDYAVHPEGHSVAVTVRGKSFTMPFWEEAPAQQGVRDGVRYRLAQWLNDGKRIIAVSDENGEEAIEVHYADNSKPKVRFDKFNIGRPLDMSVSPVKDQIVFSNQRQEVVFIDLETKKMRVLDHSKASRITGVNWSPDGQWVAYGFPETAVTTCIKICNVTTGKSHKVTNPILMDVAPSFDPEGKYLYFISYREFNPVYDNLLFDLNFPRGTRPCALPLRKDILSPFIPVPHAPEAKAAKMLAQKLKGEKQSGKSVNVEIDFDGIEDRVVAFPVPEGRYDQIWGLEGKVAFSSFPIPPGSLDQSWSSVDIQSNGTLEVYDFTDQKKDTIIESGITDFKVGRDNRTMIYRAGRKLRVVTVGEPVSGKNASDSPSRQTGWIDLSRLKVSIMPTAEWRQMYREAWRLQR
ncbi:MAG TPA: peptidase, partial [Candidatus Kapabacteria bacterium]|nr:peptidase [Candidatus Kapabacteria bacterium]